MTLAVAPHCAGTQLDMALALYPRALCQCGRAEQVPQDGTAMPVPVLLTAQACGVQLAQHIGHLLSRWQDAVSIPQAPHYDERSGQPDLAHRSGPATAWLALQLLPYACANTKSLADQCYTVLSQTDTYLKSLQLVAPQTEQVHPVVAGQRPDMSALQRDVLLLHCQALRLLRPAVDNIAQRELAGRALQLLQQHSCVYHAVLTAAEVLEAARSAGVKCPVATLSVRAPPLACAWLAIGQTLQI